MTPFYRKYLLFLLSQLAFPSSGHTPHFFAGELPSSFSLPLGSRSPPGDHSLSARALNLAGSSDEFVKAE